MSRPRNPTLMAAWKLYMPATLTSRVELLLYDPLTKKAKHGERARITAQLWEDYLARLGGHAEGDIACIPLPQLDNAVFLFEGQRFTYEQLRTRLS